MHAEFVHKQTVNFIRESDIVKKAQRSSFKLNPLAAAIAMAMASQFSANMALAGSGWGNGTYVTNPALSVPVQTYYANSPAGSVTKLDSTGSPTIDPVSNLPLTVDTGKALRKFVDTLPGIPGITSFGANNLGQYIPVAIPEKWTDAQGNKTDDYYEIAAVEFSEQMHSDLPKATHLRGYVQLSTLTNPGKHIQLFYPDSTAVLPHPILDVNGAPVFAFDNPHHLGPIIQATSGTAVRVKFTNYLPVGGNLFLPVDKSITGAGLGPDGKTYYTENRAEIHLVGGQAPWVSAGSPHQWVAPAGETAAYAAGLGKGASAQNVPDMADPGAGSTTLYFPNTQSARFMFYQDRTSGLTRLNSYAGLEAGYFVTDPTEAGLIASGAIPADQIPLIIEDKTFVPANVVQQDAKWDTTHWGQAGDLWFPHVYETNQDPKSINATNPVGRWDYGPWFWPIFAATQPLPSGVYGDASFVPESYEDTPVINGTAYPTLTVDPKAYRFRILNASNDRYLNLGLYRADTMVQAPQLDRNGNPIFDATGTQQFFTNTEVKMVPAIADTTGAPLVPSNAGVGGVAYDPACLCQYPTLPQLQPTIAFSGPTRAWPTDSRVGGAPDPTAVGPDFIAIGSDGGFLPNPVDIPSQPITYEQNRRSVTVTNVYGYGLLVGPSERADTIVDFSAYAGQTLILYNDAPTPFPFDDQRDDYYTADSDLTGSGGAYSTKPGYGPNTRTMMQIKVNATILGTTPAVPFSAGTLLTALPAAYAASQPAPIVPESAYNTAFGTNNTDNYAHVATGSVAQPNLDFTAAPAGGTVNITGVNLISSGGQVVVGTTNIVGNAVPGSGTGYTSAPTVSFPLPGTATCATTPVATAVVDNTSAAVAATANHPALPAGHQPSYQVIDVNVTTPGVCTAVPDVVFSGGGGVGAQGAVVATTSAGTTSQSILVQTKAEQELFDASGRYNSTGGVELPLTSGTTQTTIPLNYIDSPTEIIGDSEVQLWKIVDNGFWSNSMHFDFVDVQLINRVGWDGTVKAPASNEVGWKDTLRLNPLEDVIIATRAKHPLVPFGLPASKRLQDPSVKAGAVGSGLGFTADPGVTSPAGVALLTTTTNVTANYDNEYVWNTAILGHSEDDFMRPIAYHPTVTTPSAPVITGGTGGALSWTDATPAGVPATLGNPANEVGFKVLRASYQANGTLNAYAQIGATPANATGYTDATQVAGTDYSYEVVAWNNAGSATSTGYTEVTATAAPTWAATNPVVINASGTVTLTWNKVTGATGYIVTANGVALPVIAAAGGNGTQSATVTLPLGSINYTSITVTAQKVKYGLTANSTPSTALTANLTPPVAPNVSNVATTGLTLTWTAVTGATGYTLQYSTNGGTTWFNVGTGTNGVRTTTASLGATSTSAAILGLTANTSYSFQLRANNSTWSNPANATTLAVTPGVPSVTTTGITSTGFTLNFAVAGATSYNVIVGGVTTNQTASTLVVSGTPGTSYGPYTVQACSNNATTCSAASTAVTVVTPPVAPTAPTAASISATTLTLNWNAAAGATSYNLQRANNAAFTGTVTNITTGVTGLSQSVTGLTANTSYYFRVQAVVSGTNPVSGTASANVLTLPGTPTAVAAVNGTAGGAITGGLRWTAPTGGAGALTYTVSWSGPIIAGVNTGTNSSSATATSNTQITIPGATAGQVYSMNVTANNAAGSGVTSSSVNVTVQ